MKNKEPNSLIKNLFTIILICLCLLAANWQFQRGVDRHQLNANIEANLKKDPLEELPSRIEKKNEWRFVSVKGRYLIGENLLKKNSYNEGEYGFELLTKFKTDSGNLIWVDRGWVKAGADAKTAPKLPDTKSDETLLYGNIQSGLSLVQGTFFALPTKATATTIRINLISEDGIAISNPAELPSLSDGPHFAYSLQWIFFAGLIIYGRILIRRQALSVK